MRVEQVISLDRDRAIQHLILFRAAIKIISKEPSNKNPISCVLNQCERLRLYKAPLFVIYLAVEVYRMEYTA